MLVKRLAFLAALLFAAPAFGQQAKVVTDCSGVTYDTGSVHGLIQDQNGKLCVNNVAAAGAPSDATFITETANASLSAEFALGSLATGLLKNATTTGIPTVVVEAAGIDTWLTTPLSANLRSALTDESGTGVAYFQGGDLGTPSAGVGTNLTAIPIATGITGSSANLKTALSDELDGGSGLAIFSAGALNVTSGKTLASTNSITIAGTDASTINVGTGGTLGTAAFVATGTSGGTVPLLNGANAWSGANTWNVNGQNFTTSSGAGTPLTVAQTAASGSNATAAINSTMTGSASMSSLSIAPSWNTSAGPLALKINVTNTASSAAARLIDLQVAAASKFSVDVSGNTIVAGTLSTTGSIAASGGAVVTNPTFLVTASADQTGIADNTATALTFWNTESQDVGAKFASNEWCPSWTGAVELTVSLRKIDGTTVALNQAWITLQKGTTGAETNFLVGPLVLAPTTSTWGGTMFSAFDVAGSTDCYRVAVTADVASGTVTVGVNSSFGGRAF